MGAHNEAPGHSDVGIQNLLSALCLSLKPRRVLEIGGHIGFGALTIGSALRTNQFGKCITLEPNPRYYELLSANIERAAVGPYVQALELPSTDAGAQRILEAEAPFEVIFIDAQHSFTAALEDLKLAVRYLNQSGSIVCHDTSDYARSFDETGKGGVREAILALVEEAPTLQASFFEHPVWLNQCGAAIITRKTLREPK
jgi:predicted O-methyltransferase YrrM